MQDWEVHVWKQSDLIYRKNQYFNYNVLALQKIARVWCFVYIFPHRRIKREMRSNILGVLFRTFSQYFAIILALVRVCTSTADCLCWLTANRNALIPFCNICFLRSLSAFSCCTYLAFLQASKHFCCISVCQKLTALCNRDKKTTDYRRCRDGAVVRALASHHCGTGSIPGPDVTCGLSLLLFSSLLQGFFSGFSGFPPSTKTNTPNSNSIWKINEGHRFVSLLLVSPSLNKVIYFVIFLFTFLHCLLFLIFLWLKFYFGLELFKKLSDEIIRTIIQSHNL